MNTGQNMGREGVSAVAVNGFGHRCPECGGQLMRTGMCFTCLSCGWGGCG